MWEDCELRLDLIRLAVESGEWGLGFNSTDRAVNSTLIG